ncbi:20S rRNA accumulation protein 4 [Cyphellophora attinorum]|uniref:20S rRNA accumulation protein 4 n=1 Tax=Cyphellophora attinorum TaxID=1664694 RepID=A0A0N1HS34_9EURO|nr:20S rRNA accumulation protein 4 [Phialophora attinorum]KPI41314.1 20S rRNA accumulation protein 4 [Phialophora attinorum]
MAPRDAESSSEDDNDGYTTTNVTLGYASHEPVGDDISHLGGHSTWIDDGHKPSGALAKCKVCNGYTSLLLQLNADLQQQFPNDDRRLHIFCCRKKTCSKKIGSVRAFREVRKPAVRQRQTESKNAVENAADVKSNVDIGSALFGSAANKASPNANPFSLFSSSSAAVNPFSTSSTSASLAAIPPQSPVNDSEPPIATFADKLKISTASSTSPSSTQPAEPWPVLSSLPPAFPHCYLDAEAEELEPEATAAEGSKAAAAVNQFDTDDSSAVGADKDTFESTLDKTFQKFSDRIAQNSEQVLRYEFKGQPLLYSGHDDVASRFVVPHGKAGAVRGIPRCQSCGAQRAFELQLVPGLIFELEKDETMDLDDGMEWGTILVGTCTNNCGDTGQISFREEWVGVQWEERTAKTT